MERMEPNGRPLFRAYLKELSVEFERKGWTYRQQDNRGPGAARNLGAGFAKGEFIMVRGGGGNGGKAYHVTQSRRSHSIPIHATV